MFDCVRESKCGFLSNQPIYRNNTFRQSFNYGSTAVVMETKFSRAAAETVSKEFFCSDDTIQKVE